MANGERRVSSWSELHDSLYQDSWMSSIKRFRSQYAFRGLPDANFDLKTSLVRLGGDYAEMEGHLLRNFQKYAQRDVVQHDSFWHWLAVAQHHGLPTRLLDWTFSPFVAMHFATADMNSYDADAAILCVNYVAAHELLPEPLKSSLHEEGSDVFTVNMLNDVTPSLRTLEQLAPAPFVVFFEPPSIDDRIVNQYALFSLLSNPHTQMYEWLNEHPEMMRKIVIPRELKWEIRDKLDQANVTERVLFPGLDGLSAWLKRHYSPRE